MSHKPTIVVGDTVKAEEGLFRRDAPFVVQSITPHPLGGQNRLHGHPAGYLYPSEVDLIS